MTAAKKNKHMCYALVATNIPFNKLQSTPFKNFLQKYVNQNIPNESTLQKNYLKICFESTLKKIWEKLTNNFIYIMVDETTDSRGLYICSLIVGILHLEIMPTSFLSSCKESKKTNYEMVSRFVNDSLMEFFGDTLFQDKILPFISNAALYMIKTRGALKIFYSNMIHITCVAHGLNHVAEKCMKVDSEILCETQKQLFSKFSLSGVTITRRVEELGTGIESTLKESISKFIFYSTALDENAEQSDVRDVGWLSRGKFLKRIFDLKNKIFEFAENKGNIFK
ncbi:hypothetical protein QTP88_024620 [Uroleucon formosanum]